MESKSGTTWRVRYNILPTQIMLSCSRMAYKKRLSELPQTTIEWLLRARIECSKKSSFTSYEQAGWSIGWIMWKWLKFLVDLKFTFQSNVILGLGWSDAPNKNHYTYMLFWSPYQSNWRIFWLRFLRMAYIVLV